MNIPETVILKFFRGECNEEEEQQVKLYFIKHPGELEKYMTEESWGETSGYPMPDALSSGMLEKIEAKTYRPVAVKMRARWMAAAAVILLTLGAGWLVQHAGTGKEDKLLTAANTKKVTDTLPALTTRTNNTEKVVEIRLKDGSIIELEAKSSISFQEPFRDNRRDLYLQGNALFRVATHKEMPFTVHAGNTATTALGTVFRVQENKKGMVQVRLYSGRVMVKPIRQTRTINDSSAIVYLNPGQEVLYADNGSMPIVKAFVAQKAAAAPADNKGIQLTALSFANESLKRIFEKLQKNRGVVIRYNDQDIQDMSFTGNYSPAKETVDSFIETIALLNGLSVKKEKNIYYINR
jgi:ferric-dicitrate binding protein FerR (iron transport regulator)